MLKSNRKLLSLVELPDGTLVGSLAADIQECSWPEPAADIDIQVGSPVTGEELVWKSRVVMGHSKDASVKYLPYTVERRSGAVPVDMFPDICGYSVEPERKEGLEVATRETLLATMLSPQAITEKRVRTGFGLYLKANPQRVGEEILEAAAACYRGLPKVSERYVTKREYMKEIRRIPNRLPHWIGKRRDIRNGTGEYLSFLEEIYTVLPTVI